MHAHLNYLRRKVVHRALNWFNTITSIADTPKGVNVMLITVRHELAETQLYPFHYYRETLKTKYGVRCGQISIESLVADASSGKNVGQHRQIKRVFFQPAFEMPADKMVQALQCLKHAYPNANIGYFDWYAPLHIRHAGDVDPYIDLYIKKQTYIDFARYSQPTLGDTNLDDYYAKRHGLPDPPQQFAPPAGFENKMHLGSNFSLSTLMVDMFLGSPPSINGRDIDLHARIAVNGVPWYKAMRQEARDAVSKLQGVRVVSEGRVRRYKFYEELQRSKLCFSPFGYGEVCWRDYEAHATGALLLKPDVSHLRVLPNIFVPFETYVPLQWDLADLDEKVREYLSDSDARLRIARQGFAVNAEWIKSRDFVGVIAGMCE